MADPLCYLKELALKEINPRLFTIATLTGHAARTYGDNYTVEWFDKLEENFSALVLQAVMDNGPARKNRIAEKLQALGEEVGDPFEISTVRREVRCLSILTFFFFFSLGL